MSDTKFIKTAEDFVCEHCGAKVVGDGYTNHCPQCLWSKHVDINPGDRAAICQALMEPIGLIVGKEWIIVHRCLGCGKTIKNKVAEKDDRDQLVVLANKVLPNIS